MTEGTGSRGVKKAQAMRLAGVSYCKVSVKTVDSIFREVCSARKLHPDDVRGMARDGYLVAARKEVAHRLKALGVSNHSIARVLHKNHSTISNYFPAVQFKKIVLGCEMRILGRLEKPVANRVREIASAQGVRVDDLIARWVSERAEVREDGCETTGRGSEATGARARAAAETSQACGASCGRSAADGNKNVGGISQQAPATA